MKTVDEVLKEIKGEGNEQQTLTGKNPFNQSSFDSLVHALVNDTSYKVPQYDPKTGEKVGEINISEKIREDLKKTLDNAKYPQKSEANVLDSCEITTRGLSQSFFEILGQQLDTGKKTPLPPRPDMTAALYIADVPASERTIPIRDPQTQKDLGTADITTEAYKQLRAQSPAPEHKKTTKRNPPKN